MIGGAKRAALAVTLAGIGAFASASAPPRDDWRTALAELDASAPERRRAAEQRLRSALPPHEVAPLLDRGEEWSPTAAVAIEKALIELPRLRGALLQAALRSDADHASGAERARELLAVAAEQRAGELSPWRLELEVLRERRLPWSAPGWRALRSGAARATLPLVEVEAALRRAGALDQALLLFPGLLADGVRAPLATAVAADAWLELELLRRDVTVVRGRVATWLLPRALAEGELPADTEKGSVELEQRAACERRWLLAALARCAQQPLEEGGRVAGALLLRLGLDWVAGTSGVAELDRALLRAHAEWRGGVEPSLVAPPPFPQSPLATGAELRSELADFLASAPAAGAATAGSGADRTSAWSAALRELVDRAAGRPREEALLCGEFADALRRSAAANDHPEWSAACERGAAEFWLLGRCERPGRALLLLPSGTPPR